MDENEALLARFTRLTAEELELMRLRAEPEGLQLEMKTMAESGEPSDNDRKNLSKCLSAFANAAGGIVLWGVSTVGKNGEQMSRVSQYVPIQNGLLAQKRLSELSEESTQPRVNGVRHERIDLASGGTVIKTLIPASDATPHRTIGANGQYYKRSGSSNRSMEHYEIADMFGRRARPLLDLQVGDPRYHRDYARLGVSPFPACAVVSLQNSGRGAARYAAVKVELDSDLVQLRDSAEGGMSGWPRRPRRVGNASLPFVFEAPTSTLVYPGEIIEVFELKHRAYPREEIRRAREIKVRYTLYADGTEPKPGEFTLDAHLAYERVVLPELRVR